MSWLQPRKERLFILSDNGNYDFDVKFEYCELINGFCK